MGVALVVLDSAEGNVVEDGKKERAGHEEADGCVEEGDGEDGGEADERSSAGPSGVCGRAPLRTRARPAGPAHRTSTSHVFSDLSTLDSKSASVSVTTSAGPGVE